jgi:nitrogen fixation/metabolism regulation signal transduction histidine kinase
MVKNYDNQSQIKSLSPFIYNKAVQLRESDLNEIIGGIKGLLPQYADSGIDFKMIFADEDLRVMADVTRMEKVLLHLVSCHVSNVG